MGKFFVAGVFLGAAGTFAVMHFMKEKEITEEVLKKKVEEERQKATAAVTKAEKTWQEKLRNAEAALAEKHKTALAEKDSARAAVETELKGAGERLEAATRQLKALADEKAALEKRLEAAAGASRSSDAPKGLLARRVALVETEVKLWRTLGEVNAGLGQAKLGWPDVDAIRRKAKALPDVAKEYAKAAREVKKFLEENSADLGRDLGDLERYRSGVQDKDIKAIDSLIEKIQAAVAGMKLANVTVSARAEGWTDSAVYVGKGDIVQVRATGAWKMKEHWPPAGPEGWEGGTGEDKITQKARAGSLIVRISISENISPAYLGQPITADQEGRVVLRMNDKDTVENGGEVAARVLSMNPAALEKAVAEWRKVVGE